MERVLEAISALPDGLVDQDSAGLYRMKDSKTNGNAATTNEPLRETVLYDAAFAPSKNLARVLAHELAHLMFVRLEKPLRNEFLTAANWVLELERNRKFLVLRRPPRESVTIHSRLSPHEDFATAIDYFIFENPILKKTTPKVHAWIDKHLGARLKKRSEP